MSAPTLPAEPHTAPTPDSSQSVAPEPAEAPAAAAESAPAPTLLQRAQALVKSKPALQAEASDFKNQLAAATDQIENLTAEKTDLTAQVQSLTTELEAVEAVVTTLESEAQTVTAAATDMVAATGIPADELPAQEAESADDEKSLLAALAASQDPREKGVISAKLRALR